MFVPQLQTAFPIKAVTASWLRAQTVLSCCLPVWQKLVPKCSEQLQKSWKQFVRREIAPDSTSGIRTGCFWRVCVCLRPKYLTQMNLWLIIAPGFTVEKSKVMQFL